MTEGRLAVAVSDLANGPEIERTAFTTLWTRIAGQYNFPTWV